MPGGGPGDHPGVTVVSLTTDVVAVSDAIESALESERAFIFQYQASGQSFAVFASDYKGK